METKSTLIAVSKIYIESPTFSVRRNTFISLGATAPSGPDPPHSQGF